MQVSLNNCGQNSMQCKQNQPSFGIKVSKRFIKAAQQNLTGKCMDLGEDFLAKVSEIKVLGNKTTVYDYTQKEGKHILSVVDCVTIGDKFFPKKALQVEKQENFLDLINAFIKRDKGQIKSEELLITDKSQRNAFNELIERAPDINL